MCHYMQDNIRRIHFLASHFFSIKYNVTQEAKDMVGDIVWKWQPLRCQAGDFISRRGATAREMCFLVRGIVTVFVHEQPRGEFRDGMWL